VHSRVHIFLLASVAMLVPIVLVLVMSVPSLSGFGLVTTPKPGTSRDDALYQRQDLQAIINRMTLQNLLTTGFSALEQSPITNINMATENLRGYPVTVKGDKGFTVVKRGVTNIIRAGLLHVLNSLKPRKTSPCAKAITSEPRVVERIIEKPCPKAPPPRIVERVLEKPCPSPVVRSPCPEAPPPEVVERIIEKPVFAEKACPEAPPPQILERVVEKPVVVERFLDKPCPKVSTSPPEIRERVIEVPVPCPEPVCSTPAPLIMERIVKEPCTAMSTTPGPTLAPRIVEKVVHKVVKVPQIIERVVKVPQIVEVEVCNPSEKSSTTSKPPAVPCEKQVVEKYIQLPCTPPAERDLSTESPRIESAPTKV